MKKQILVDLKAEWSFFLLFYFFFSFLWPAQPVFLWGREPEILTGCSSYEEQLQKFGGNGQFHKPGGTHTDRM
jgi:hypothetical protein